jgi:integrase/recombinase XerD
MFSYYDTTGKQRTKSLGDLGTLSVKRKKEIKRDLELRYETKNLNKGHSLKFDFLIDDYLKEKTKEVTRGQRSQNTLNSDNQHLKRFSDFVKDKFGRLEINEINRKILQSYMDYRFTVDGCNNSTVGNNIRGIQGFFRYCVDENQLEVNPTSNLKIPQPLKRTTDDIPSKTEFNKIRDHLNNYVVDYLNDKEEFNWVKLVSWIQIRTGMRNGEVLMMKWKQNKTTDRGEGHSFSFVYLSPSLTKLVIHFKKRRREIPIKKDIRDVLSKIKNDKLSKVYVFECNEDTVKVFGHIKHTNTHFNNSSFSRPFKKLLKEISIKNNYTSHTLRHGFITNLLREDKSIYRIGTLVGHSTSRITELYGHLISKDLEDLIY